MKRNYCCSWMKHFAETTCDQHPDRSDCADALVHYSKQHKKFGLLIHDGGSSFMTINYCPWCGTVIGKDEPARMIDV